MYLTLKEIAALGVEELRRRYLAKKTGYDRYCMRLLENSGYITPKEFEYIVRPY